jgi:hypothetical protein
VLLVVVVGRFVIKNYIHMPEDQQSFLDGSPGTQYSQTEEEVSSREYI